AQFVSQKRQLARSLVSCPGDRLANAQLYADAVPQQERNLMRKVVLEHEQLAQRPLDFRGLDWRLGCCVHQLDVDPELITGPLETSFYQCADSQRADHAVKWQSLLAERSYAVA